MIYVSNVHIHYFFNIDVLYISNTVINSKYINIQLILPSIVTIFNGLFDCFIRMKQLLFNFNVLSYYKFIHCYLWIISHSSMILQSINEFDLMIYKIIDIIQCKFKETSIRYSQNKAHIDRKDQSNECMYCVSVNDILILTITNILSIYSFYIVVYHLLIEKQALIHVFDAVMIVLIVYYQSNPHECENFNDLTDETSRDVDMDHMIDWSIIAIFNGLWSIFINLVVIGCNNDDYKLYCSSLINSTMIYLSITMTELIFYYINQWVKQYCNKLSDKLDEYNSKNDAKYQLNGNMHDVSIDGILLRIMIIVCIPHFVYRLKNYSLFQEMTLSYLFMQNSIIFIVYSMILCNYFNQKNGILLVHYILLCFLYCCIVFD